MGTEGAASKVLEGLVDDVRRYNDLMKQLDDCLTMAETIRKESVPLRVTIQGTASVLKSLAATVPDDATRAIFLVLSDCYGVK